MATPTSRASVIPEGDRYYLLRGNIMVPLVPADQIPLQLRGLPRQLTHRQMSDENWKLLHETKHAALPLVIQIPDSITPSSAKSCSPTLKPSTSFLAPDHHVRSSSKDPNEETAEMRRWPSASRSVLTASANSRATHTATEERPVSLTDTFASIYQKDALRFAYQTPYPSGLEPDQSKKEFCTYWIKSGECAFTSFGCKYKHEMPTMDKLREIGFTQLPKWWKEKSAIITKGPTWMQRRLAAGHKDDAKVEEVPPPCTFPDPSTFISRKPENSAQSGEALQPRTIVRKEFKDQRTTPSRVNKMGMSKIIARPDSPIMDLLIDIDESPQPSRRSSVSASSSDERSSSGSSSTSSRSTAALDEPALRTIRDIPTFRRQSSLREKTALDQESLSHKNSSIDNTRAPVRSSIKNTTVSRRAPRPTHTPAKQAGLANSKYAVVNRNLWESADQYNDNSTRKTAGSGQATANTRERFTQSRNATRTKARLSRRTPAEMKRPTDTEKRLPA